MTCEGRKSLSDSWEHSPRPFGASGNDASTGTADPADGRRHSGWCDLPGSRLAPSIARRWVAAMLDAWNVALPVVDQATIAELTSELVTNAVQHAKPGPSGDQEIRVNVRVAYGLVWLAVCDRDPTLPVQRAPDFAAECGRGLFLVDAQADQWGFVRYHGGKYVWFGIECPGPARRELTAARPELTVAPTSPHIAIAIDRTGPGMSPVALPHVLSGTGPHRVIALHGWFGDRDAFAKIRPYLNGEAFTYAFPDYRGYGEARDLTGDYTLAEVAGDVIALADKLGWEEFSLVGHSMGGTVIQRVMLDAPGRVRRMVGISPVPASGVPFDEQGWALFNGAADEPANRRTIIDFTTGGRLPDSWLDEMVDHSLRISTIPAFRAYLDAWARTDFHDEVVGNTTPVLVIAGAHDPALSADVMRGTWLEWYPNAALSTLQDAGHYAMDETPLALVAEIERFLAA